jgi:hypothetical protein
MMPDWTEAPERIGLPVRFFRKKKMGAARSVFWNIDFNFCENPCPKLTKMEGAGTDIFGGQN